MSLAPELRSRIVALWFQGLNTFEIGQELEQPEHKVHAFVRSWRDRFVRSTKPVEPASAPVARPALPRNFPANLTSSLMGDPPFGRSALDQRRVGL